MKYRVKYQVHYEAVIDVENGDSVDDAVADIDIPVGGADHSEYVEKSFTVLNTEVYDEVQS